MSARLVALVVVVCSGVARADELGTACLAEAPTTCAAILRDVTATAVVGKQIVLAGLSTDRVSTRPRDAWRFRTLTLPESSILPTSATLSADGTAVRVAPASGTGVFDLTSASDVLTEEPPPSAAGANASPLPAGSKRRRLSEDLFDETPATSLAAADPEGHCDARVLATYSKELERQATARLRTDTRIDWTFRVIEPDCALYSPLLQLVKGDIRPSSFGVWQRVKVDEAAGKRRRIDQALRQFEAQPPGCVIHYHVMSLPGSWLFQYWLYYPVDAGAYEDHLHDSEHLFVEVEKLGGWVRRVVGAAHGDWTTNNIYEAFRRNSPPVTLPIHAIVEFRKHATAPDINADGLFTPGIDTNQFLDPAKVWGVRDTIGRTDANVRPFDASMQLARRPEDACAATETVTRFENLRVHCGCKLEKLPSGPIGAGCSGGEATEGCAREKVVTHPDWLEPRRILKPAAFPEFVFRTGGGFHPAPTAPDAVAFTRFWVPNVYLGGGADIARITGGLLPIPGRLAVDLHFRGGWKYKWEDEADEDPETVKKRFGYAGMTIRYERPITNLLGSYIGLSWKDDLRGGIGNGWLDFGLLAERAQGPRHSWNAALGLTFNNEFGLAFDVRLGVGRRASKLPRFGGHRSGQHE